MPIALKTNVSKKPLLSVGLVSDIRQNIVGEKSIPNSSRRNFLITNENVNTEYHKLFRIHLKYIGTCKADIAIIIKDTNMTKYKSQVMTSLPSVFIMKKYLKAEIFSPLNMLNINGFSKINVKKNIGHSFDNSCHLLFATIKLCLLFETCFIYSLSIIYAQKSSDERFQLIIIIPNRNLSSFAIKPRIDLIHHLTFFYRNLI